MKTAKILLLILFLAIPSLPEELMRWETWFCILLGMRTYAQE
jgi:hypothetical protein